MLSKLSLEKDPLITLSPINKYFKLGLKMKMEITIKEKLICKAKKMEWEF